MKKQFIICSMVFALFLTSCSNVKQTERLFAQISTLETEMSQIQEKIYALNEEEAVIFEEIITMGGSDGKQIEVLANEALLKLEENAYYLAEEKDIFMEAKEKLTKIEKMNKEETDANLSEMISLLEERYTHYNQLYEEKAKSIQLNEELYELLIRSADIKQTEEILQKINENEAELQANHEQLNVLTDKYNELVMKR